MTEEEWLACTYPILMLRHLDAGANDRRTLLLTVACLRGIQDLLTEGGLHWLEVADANLAGGEWKALPDEDGEDGIADAYNQASAERRGVVDAILDVSGASAANRATGRRASDRSRTWFRHGRRSGSGTLIWSAASSVICSVST